VDLIYSQAGAFHEPDQASFVTAAARLLRPNGVLIYNHQEASSDMVRCIVEDVGMRIEHQCALDGPDGELVFMQKLALLAAFSALEWPEKSLRFRSR